MCGTGILVLLQGKFQTVWCEWKREGHYGATMGLYRIVHVVAKNSVFTFISTIAGNVDSFIAMVRFVIVWLD